MEERTARGAEPLLSDFSLSADGIVFRLLGNVDKSEAGMALEEVLATLGGGGAIPQTTLRRVRLRHAGDAQLPHQILERGR
jgi:hypothetical protein